MCHAARRTGDDPDEHGKARHDADAQPTRRLVPAGQPGALVGRHRLERQLPARSGPSRPSSPATRTPTSSRTSSTYQQPGYAQPGYGQPGYGQPGYGQPQRPAATPCSRSSRATPRATSSSSSRCCSCSSSAAASRSSPIVGNEVNDAVNDDTLGGPNNPLTITEGQAFEVDGFEYADGWTIPPTPISGLFDDREPQGHQPPRQGRPAAASSISLLDAGERDRRDRDLRGRASSTRSPRTPR